MAPSAGTRWSRRARSATAASTTRTATTNAAFQEVQGSRSAAGMEITKFMSDINYLDLLSDGNIYRVTIQVASNLPLTSKQKLRFSTWASY